jgi:K+-sensing histidine kinase KdpD
MVAAAGRPLEPGTFEAFAGIAAIALERAQFLDERKSAELARQSEELKSRSLPRSVTNYARRSRHQGRAGNLQGSGRTSRSVWSRATSSCTKWIQLTRLFQNILEMAALDAGAITEDMRWVGAIGDRRRRAQSRGSTRSAGRKLRISVESDRLARLDPRV